MTEGVFHWRDRTERTCDNCGSADAYLVGEGYITPLPDVAPTHHEWREYWLCKPCEKEMDESALTEARELGG